MLLKYFRLGLVLVAGCLLLMAISYDNLSGQEAAQKPSGSRLPPKYSDQTYHVSVELVNVFCSVFDRRTNNFVTSLTQNDFTVYEDQKKQEIQNFARETNMPLTIAMLVDTSDSVGPKLKFEQDAATAFFQSILKEKEDRGMLLEFDSSVGLLQDFTGDPNKLAKAIKKLKAAGGTALYDAIYETCDEKLIREIGRKAIVILSDGNDTNSKRTLHQATEMALRAEATIFSISVSRGGYFGVTPSGEGDPILTNLAEETGGKVFFPFKVEDLEQSFREINQELRSQYNLGYISNNKARDGSYRKIEIKVQERGLKLRYRKGYYAPSS